MKLNEEELEKLYHYFLDGGSVEYADVGKFLNVDHKKDVKLIDTAIDDLRAAYPNLKEEVAAAKAKREKPAKTEKKAEPLTIILNNESGIGEELEFVAQKGNRIYVKHRVPTDLVTVKIGGQDVEIDLIALRKKQPSEQLHGVSVQTLLMLGAVAKG